jgi:hypothetical protein
MFTPMASSSQILPIKYYYDKYYYKCTESQTESDVFTSFGMHTSVQTLKDDKLCNAHSKYSHRELIISLY